MKTRLLLLVPVLAATLVIPWALAAPEDGKPEQYKVDPIHSYVFFRIKHLNVGYSYGHFREIDGEFTFDTAHPEQSTFQFKVPVAGIDTANEKRDQHLKSPDYFNLDKYANITFKSTKLEKKKDAKKKEMYELTGDLTLLGTTKEIKARLEHVGAAMDPRDSFRSGFEAKFTIKRSEFGMTEAVGMLGDEVTLMVAFEGIRQ